MQVGQIMTKRVVTVELDDTLNVVKKIFEQMDFHHLLVVENNKLYGVLSDRDLFKAISPRLGFPSETPQDTATLNKKVHQVMSRKPISLPSDADIYLAISTFNQHNISCIPIIDDNSKPIGILSWRDVFRVIEENHNKK
jgi:acetoin utilization protein AcuB